MWTLARWFLTMATLIIVVTGDPQSEGMEYASPGDMTGINLFAKDILLTPEQWQAAAQRKAMTPSFWLPDADGYPLVPYRLSNGVNKEAIEAGLQHWMDHTCIKFEETTNFNQSHVVFVNGGSCWSYLGRLYHKNAQYASIGDRCTSLGSVVHLLGHTLGFLDEDLRSDRDDYIHVLWDNVWRGAESYFYVRSTDNHGVPYDYTSIMHMSDKIFSRSDNLTLLTTDPIYQELLGQRRGLSHYDKLLANRVYNCTGKWLEECGLTSDPCENGGYTGADCKCVCPDGTAGQSCGENTVGYYEYRLSRWTEVINYTGVVTSPTYPTNYDAAIRCSKVIRSPECTLPVVSFTDFDLPPRLWDVWCYWNILVIRTDNFTVKTFCGEEISPGDTFTSTVGEISLYHFSSGHKSVRGWSANVTFVPIEGCRRREEGVSQTRLSEDEKEYVEEF